MKYLLLVPDGMADYPVAALSGRTPLEAAATPHMDTLARTGRCGTLLTVPEGMPAGSAVANLSLLGYDPRRTFNGRGVLEAASMGVALDEDDVAPRCNTICLRDGRIKNHSAGHISTEEAAQLIQALATELGTPDVAFVRGVSYRHLLVLRRRFSPSVTCVPPHDAVGTAVDDILPKARVPEAQDTVRLLHHLIARSRELLPAHPVNQRRRAIGHDPANCMWPWSPGRKPRMATFQEQFGIRGAVISAVDLIKGIGVYAGFTPISVEGATGLYTTNYEGKAAACLQALQQHDLVWVHVEAPDEAGHEQDLQLKLRCIEDFDRRLVGPILKGLATETIPVTIAVAPDHRTPLSVGTHTAEEVPFLIREPRQSPDSVVRFGERAALQGSLGQLDGRGFLAAFLGEVALSHPGMPEEDT